VNRGLEGPAMPEVSETSSEWLLMTIQGVRKSLYNVKQESVQFHKIVSHGIKIPPDRLAAGSNLPHLGAVISTA